MGGEGREGPPVNVCLDFLADIFGSSKKAQMCLVKRQLRVNRDFKGNPDRSQTVETSERCGSETSLLHIHITCSL